MTINETENAWTLLAMPPIPMLTGSAFTGDGGVHRVATVSLVVTAEDGTELSIPLTAQYGGWWARP